MLEQIFVKFDRNHVAKAIIVASKVTPPQDVIQIMNLESPPQGILSISGGAGRFPPDIEPHTRVLIESIIIPLAVEHKLMIVDGGTDAGIMQILGDAVESYFHILGQDTQPLVGRPMLVGFAPRPKIYAPGIAPISNDSVLLNENHTYPILIADVDDWGEEVEYMSSFIHHFVADRSIPALHVIFNGGRITLKEVYYAVKQQRSVLLLEGTTRAVEILAAIDKKPFCEIVQMLLDKRRNIAGEEQLEETVGWLSVIANNLHCVERFDMRSQSPTEFKQRILSYLKLV
jgi:hypothetical protein